jgi:hypothetical protein
MDISLPYSNNIDDYEMVGLTLDEMSQQQSDCITHVETQEACFSPRSPNHRRHTNHIWYRPHRSRWKIGIIIFLSLISTLYVTQKRTRRTESIQTNKMKWTEGNVIEQNSDVPHVLYRCPTIQRSVADIFMITRIEHKLWYESVSESITNVASYMETFRHVEFDNWGHTYDEVKHGMYSWKSRYFKDIKSNDIIYESACGIGMNLYMTLEIIQHVLGVTNITIYGNDYVPQSVQIAQSIYSEVNSTMLPASFGRLGSICEADSTQLGFIPSNSFDLVYTGYISPLFDPLQLNQTTTDENFVQYNAYCEQLQHHGTNTTVSKMAAKAQQRQNDWYGKWVGEMVRIAKPGAPIIVEQVSYPYVIRLSYALCAIFALFKFISASPCFYFIVYVTRHLIGVVLLRHFGKKQLKHTSGT